MGPKPSNKARAAAAAAAASVAVEDLFTTLNRHIQRSEYSQAIKLSDQVLAVAPGDEDAIRCKVVALIKSDDIDSALSTLNSFNSITIGDLGFLQAYCLYRQNRLDEALESLKSQERNSETMLLESQILYRLGKMDACVAIYQKLQKSKIESLEINHVAALTLAGRSSQVQKTLDANRIKATSSFELAYNTAFSLIEKNQHLDAEQLLLTARRVGQETLMDDNFAEDDIEIELAPIAVQLAYVQQHLGRTQDALRAYSDIISRNLADESSLAVAVNNLVALKGPKDISDSLRKLDKLKEQDSQNFRLAHGLDKLSPNQREAIYANRVLLLIHTNRMDQARELVAALSDMFADSVLPVLLQAALLVKENKAGRAEEILGQYAEKFPEKSKLVLLSRAQVAAAAGHPHIAVESLVKIPEIQHMPATVATLVALKERAGDIAGAFDVLDSAINSWSNAMTEDNKLDVLMQEAASFKLRHGKEEEAARLYEDLVKSHGSIDILAGLVSTVARVDVSKAELYEKQLKPLPGLKEINIGSLEKTSGAKQVEASSQVTATHEEVKKEKTKKKRKRKPRYPKGFDPTNPGPPPDPERWLPKRERSSYRPKRKDKRTAQVRGSQGAVVREKNEAGTSAANNVTSNLKPKEASTSKTGAQTVAAEHSKPSNKSSKKKSRK